MDKAPFDDGLLDFLKVSPTPFHATARIASILDGAGFRRLHEGGRWDAESPSRAYLTRNESSIIAFAVGSSDPERDGLRVVGTHTDSPCLRLKPQPDIGTHGYRQLGIEVYGGALLGPWFDRDLSLAGRLTIRSENGAILSRLIDLRRPVAVIPSLAIHLDRKVNHKRSINPQTQLAPVLGRITESTEIGSIRSRLLDHVRTEHPDCQAEAVLDFELSLYDTQPPAKVGADSEFIASARLDNLLSCYVGLRALIDGAGDGHCMLVCTDHEEVGSASASGADGPFFESVVRRLYGGRLDQELIIQHSLLISADNAHGIHPNFPGKHDSGHGPMLNAGPVIKINAAQRYATDSETAARFRELCRRCEVPVQSFVARADTGCGTTIGPIMASRTGIPTVDVGIAQWAMHSIREIAGADDPYQLYRVLQFFYRDGSPRVLRSSH